jgi:predicted RecB family nuclease
MVLSKSRFTAGIQRHKLLWWKVHEPLAAELQPDKVLLDRFDQGRQVGELARARFRGGVLITGPHGAIAERIHATHEAIAGGAHTIFEGTFVAGDTQVTVDALSKHNGGWRLTEAKMTSSQKDEHLPDAAVQLHVLQEAGLDVRAVEIMHLNPEFRHPDQGELLMSTDVTSPAHGLLPTIAPEIARQLAMLGGPVPDVKIGAHCAEPRECPFVGRCWPQKADHIKKLYNVGYKRAVEYMEAGVHSVWDIPPKKKLPPAAQRQLRAMKDNTLIVEPSLGNALKDFDVRMGFLDFETINRAVPVWPGMKPWEQAAAQFSYHESDGTGGYSHAEYLADGSTDCRPELARLMIDATQSAERVATYSAFEKTRIRGLQETVPALRDELKALEDKLIDLLPVVRDHVYHPGFEGSFSIKAVLTPLVPDLSYSDLIIVDGLTASVEIARLLFVAQKIAPEERARVRKDLLAYCERDTLAMVRLLARLRELAIS